VFCQGEHSPNLAGVMLPDGTVVMPGYSVTVGPPGIAPPLPLPGIRRPSVAKPSPHERACYGPDGSWIGDGNPECQ
jgi:hypothetical protein